ncbi:hypothetical protein D3C72_332330 [compost metagenome]
MLHQVALAGPAVGAGLAVVGGEAVLGHQDRQPEDLVVAVQHVGEALGIDVPLAGAGRNHLGRDGQALVVIDGHVVHLGALLAGRVVAEGHQHVREGLQEPVVARGRQGVFFGVQADLVGRRVVVEGDHRVGVALVDDVVGPRVRLDDVHAGAGEGGDVGLARRPDADQVAGLDHHGGLVEGQVVANVLAELARDEVDVAQVGLDGLVGLPPAATLGREAVHPGGVGVVHERDDRRHAPGVHGLQHGAVAPDGLPIDLARSRLDAAPLDAEAEGVEPHVLGEIEIALVELPAVGGLARGLLDLAGGLPLGPVAGGVAAFPLVAGRGDAPEEVVGHRLEGVGVLAQRRVVGHGAVGREQVHAAHPDGQARQGEPARPQPEGLVLALVFEGRHDALAPPALKGVWLHGFHGDLAGRGACWDHDSRGEALAR